MPIGLALIVYELVSILIANGIMPIGLALIVYKIVSGFDIDNKVKSSYTWIDTDLGNPYGVGHLIHLNSL